MKTKRLLLKLFLAVCLLMAVPPREAEAATLGETLNIASGNITIKRVNTGTEADPVYEDRIIQKGDTDDSTENTAKLSTNSYTINGTAGAPRTITIEGPLNSTNDTVNLIFNSLRAANSSIQLVINNANVNVTVRGADGVLRGAAGEPAVQIIGTGQLYFSGTSESSLTIMAGPGSEGSKDLAAVKGGGLNILSGRIVLDAGSASQTDAFNGTTLNISGGTLECQRNEGGRNVTTSYGHGSLYQSGGTVVAKGLASVDVINERIVGLDSSSYLFGLATSEGGKIDYSKVGTIENVSDGIPIPSTWHGQYFCIQPQGTDAQVTQNYLYIPRRVNSRPNGFSATDETISGKSDGTISRVDSAMQYISTDEADASGNYDPNDWIDCEGNPNLNNGTLTNLEPGSYSLRYKYVDDSYNPKEKAFASEPSTPVTIKRAGSLSASLKYEFKPLRVGYTQQELDTDTASITIQNSDIAGVIPIEGITVSDTKAFKVLTGRPTINYGTEDEPYKDTSWRIQPKIGLDAGTYKADVTIKYRSRVNQVQPDIVLKDAVTFTVNKLDYAGEPLTIAPELDSRSFDSITLKPIVIEGNTTPIEYGRVSNGETIWQKDLTFTGLNADTEYKFEARFASEGNYEASAPGPQVAYKTEKGASIVYETKQLSMVPNRTYRISLEGSEEIFDEVTTNSNGLINIKDNWFGKTIVIYDTVKENSQKLDIAEIGKAPTAPVGKEESFSGAKDGEIHQVDTTMEYKLKDSTDNWTACEGKIVTGLYAGTYLVRTKAVSEGSGENRKYTFASEAKEVVVPRGSDLRISPDSKIDFGKSVYKKAVDPKAISFSNKSTTEYITIKSITLSDNSPFMIVHKDTDSQVVDPGKTNSTFKIQPKADLNVGKYTDNFVVTYVYGYDPDEPKIEAQAEGFNADFTSSAAIQSKEIEVEFEVEKADQEAPPVPAEKNASSTSITLEKIANSAESGAKAQYSKDSGSTWQDSPTFTRLKEDTEYYFVARYAETENYNQSEPSAGEAVIATTKKGDDDDDQNMNSNANGNGTNGSNGSGTNGSGTNGSSTNGTTGTNGTTTGTNGTNGTTGSGTNSNSSNRGVSAARTGDLNNIQLWITLLIGSYLSCAYIIWSRIRKAKSL